MRAIVITREQVADIARELARGFGHADPDIIVAVAPAQMVKDPFCRFENLYVVPKAEQAFPLYWVFLGAARLALAQAGRHAEVEFTEVEDSPSKEAA